MFAAKVYGRFSRWRINLLICTVAVHVIGSSFASFA